jgi:hypothetical protein
MRFDEPRIKALDLKDPDVAYKLIAEDLCGESYYGALNLHIKSQVSSVLRMAESEGLNYEQFNELLLLLDQDRVTRAFFERFFEGFINDLQHLALSVIKFRGFAMLCFGNFRFAYKHLSRCNQEQQDHAIRRFQRSRTEIIRSLKDRPSPALKINKIKLDETWCGGYLTKRKYEKEADLLAEELKTSHGNAELIKKGDFYKQLSDQIKRVEKTALDNTDVYLTWDYMDVYIATSMRNPWEFEETGDFVHELFQSGKIRNIGLRYFDPTQSLCKFRIDKGLVEALMLKRALCTVYMVQESDTMGKDSELASTLAQGKPVIAYVPKIDPVKHAEKLRGYPLDFFRIRFQILEIDGILDDAACYAELAQVDSKFPERIIEFLSDLNTYRNSQPFALWKTREDEFKNKMKGFPLVCRLLAIAEKHNFEKRAGVLKNAHPLGLQVHLESGVANGVLVVRSVAECADVLLRVLTNDLKFEIGIDEKQGCTVLKENITQCAFRAVSLYEKLANSFWNFYLSN